MDSSDTFLLNDFSRFLGEQLPVSPPSSFLHSKDCSFDEWKKVGKEIFKTYIKSPSFNTPCVESLWIREFDGLSIEKLSWTLPFGPATEAYFLKPVNYKGLLRGILGLHDHGHNKILGKSKIVRIEDPTPQHILKYQEEMYGKRAWANEIAKRGFAVLVHDVYPFESRRVMPQEIPNEVISTFMGASLEPQESEQWYNRFAYHMESLIAKSIFTAGTTWPGITVAEDLVALQILSQRDEVDSSRIGCCGISLGGLRATYLSSSTESLKATVSAGFITTWNDFILHKALSHTWMYTIPLLPSFMDFPDILSLATPNPLMVLSCIDDELFTLSEVKKAEKILRDVYEKVGYSNQFSHRYYEGSHRFSIDMQEDAFRWLERWL